MLQPSVSLPEIELVNVVAGAVPLGVAADPAVPDPASPEHRVELAAFRLARYPVTNALYQIFVRDTGHAPPLTWEHGRTPLGKEQHPVAGVSWGDAWLFCAWLRRLTGKPYALPTEAQWEKAASWNLTTRTKLAYPWGDAPDAARCNTLEARRMGTTPVGFYSPLGDSPAGCADMIGNVAEWCSSALTPYPYLAEDGRELRELAARRVLRGGDWSAPIQRVTQRGDPLEVNPQRWGFRVALSPASDSANEAARKRLASLALAGEPERAAALTRDKLSAQALYDYGAWLIQASATPGVERYADAERLLTQALELVARPPRTVLGPKKVRLDTPLAWVFYNRAVARAELGRAELALADVNEALRRDPQDNDSYLLRARLLCDLARWDPAELDLTHLVGTRQAEQSALYQELIGRVAAGRGQPERAIEAYTRVLAGALYDAPLTRVYLRRAQVFEQLGQLRAALSDYWHYLLWEPQSAAAADAEARIALLEQ